MTLKFYIKNFFTALTIILILNSCGLGGKDIEVSESAVLSGPPLAIPPDFEIDSQNPNQQQPSVYNDDFEMENESIATDDFGNEPSQQTFENDYTLVDEMPSDNQVQSFENYNPSVRQQPRQNNAKVAPRVQRSYRPAVPSDAYNFNQTSPRKKIFAQKKRESLSGFGGNEVESFRPNQSQSIDNLSQEEEFLLEDLMRDDKPATVFEEGEAIPEFEQRGDSD
tara:strand:+ start:2816 stop:3484 length:669 start_codon:yes stop_codon:yes gene_type:complete